ncbi:MAG: adenylosuccinate synthase [Flavobacteriales bacterium]|nr:adenylosuccinate synthase [Flavobacteriales bacterium]MBK7248401.1 adenylosuccinate synthase [Flavobacteriales bacterium]MBK9059394.1 adenylosuccinate synthase [Flavobacteriales bacterium]MBK9598232.1 adenylosuccinate synthase [Flavobacteriales bacterium]QQS73655.1 MAG: adenylosuccinate synthase [Flavobacteriales bacterium]
MAAKVDVLLGAQWGDEGKGKVVDVVAPDYDVIARFQGGPNAGHTLIFDGKKHVLHTIPSGVFREGVWNLVGNGVVIDPVIFLREVKELAAAGVDVRPRLLISRRAHLILPTHRALDAASEADKGKGKIGSTLKGIGPTYMDKTGRNGLRVGDIERPDLKARYDTLVAKHQRLFSIYDHHVEWRDQEKEWLDAVQALRSFTLVDSEHWLDQQLGDGRSVLAEGAQGTLLDIDFGTYPFVTSSNTISAGACTGLGVGPSRIGTVIGIFKAYCTRVGSGPFPTELHDDVGEHIRKAGNEFGSTTGRPRRCGWLDLPALRYAVMINGITELAMMKADVLSGMGTIRVCTRYRVNGKETDRLPFDITGDMEPHYTDLPGWGELDAGRPLPPEAEAYIRFVEKATGVPVRIVSVGPDRSATMIREVAAVAR